MNFMNFYKNNQNADILKIIKIQKISTVDFQQIDQKVPFKSSSSLKHVIEFYSYLFKDLKDLSPMLDLFKFCPGHCCFICYAWRICRPKDRSNHVLGTLFVIVG